jgi:hypothetical protein
MKSRISYLTSHILALSSGLLALSSTEALAQKNLSEEVNVVRPYKPILAEASKISTNPEIKVEPNRDISLEYDIRAKKVDSTLKLTVLSAEKMRNETISKLYKTYVKVGGGNYGTSFGEVYFSNTRSKESQIGLHLKHHASIGSIENADFSENQAEIFGKRIFRSATLGAKFSYDRDVNHFYGYDHEVFDFKKKDVRQVFNYLELQTNLKSNITGYSSKLFYDIGIKAYTASDEFDAAENSLSLNATLTKRIDVLPFRLHAGAELSTYNTALPSTSPIAIDSITDIGNSIVYFNPAYVYEKDKLTAAFGFNIYQELSAEVFHVYPHITADYKIIDEALIAYGGLTGRVKKNSFRDLYQENPFLQKGLILLNTNEKIELFGGLRGSLGEKTSYRVNISYYSLENVPFYFNDSLDTRKFLVIYDDGNLLKFSTELSFQQSEKLRLLAKAEINSYSMDTLREAWHKPLFNLQLSTTYNISDKFLLNLDVFGIAGAKAFDYDDLFPGTKELKGIIDANFGVDYRYSKIISVFLKLNNIAGMKYERYLNYPSYGFNALLGATFSF